MKSAEESPSGASVSPDKTPAILRVCLLPSHLSSRTASLVLKSCGSEGAPWAGLSGSSTDGRGAGILGPELSAPVKAGALPHCCAPAPRKPMDLSTIRWLNAQNKIQGWRRGLSVGRHRYQSVPQGLVHASNCTKTWGTLGTSLETPGGWLPSVPDQLCVGACLSKQKALSPHTHLSLASSL